MTVVELPALIIAAGVTLAGTVTWRRRRTRRGAPVNPTSRQPDRAEIALARGSREVPRQIPAQASTRPAQASARPTRPALHAVPCMEPVGAMFGYASWDGRKGEHARAFRGQAEEIASECSRLGVKLLEIVREREPQRGRALERPGLGYVLEGISAGDADGLVVAELCRLTRSAAELGRILQWFLDRDARLVAVDQGLDTEQESGRLAVRTIIEVSRWEHDRLVERTRNGMLAARRTGPPRVADYPQLKERIAEMRAAGMTLEAIAGQLNREGTPTIRGGAKWRPSSVQVAAGYRRPPAGHRNHPHRNGTGAKAGGGQP